MSINPRRGPPRSTISFRLRPCNELRSGMLTFYPRLDSFLIQSLAALGHVCNLFLSDSGSCAPLVSLSAITLPGAYSVTVRHRPVVVVVVVVLEVCPQANGATTANAMLNIVFFIVILPFGFHGAGVWFPPHSRRAHVSPFQ